MLQSATLKEFERVAKISSIYKTNYINDESMFLNVKGDAIKKPIL